MVSGGHYGYRFYSLDILAEEIEKDFLEDDRLDDGTPDQKKEALVKIRALISDLRSCSERARALEWYLSGDTGIDTFLEEVK